MIWLFFVVSALCGALSVAPCGAWAPWRTDGQVIEVESAVWRSDAAVVEDERPEATAEAPDQDGDAAIGMDPGWARTRSPLPGACWLSCSAPACGHPQTSPSANAHRWRDAGGLWSAPARAPPV